MIRGMVEGLAARLEDSPDDLDGWLRLVRSYKVLNEQEKARKAIASARAAFAGDEAALARIEEAEKRDHRKIGREMDLFHLQEEAQGSVFWHKKGYIIWQALEQYIRRRLEANGYDEVKTPQLLDRRFWEQSGHWDKFRENMFVVPDEVPATDDDAEVISGDADLMALKPMLVKKLRNSNEVGVFWTRFLLKLEN